MSAQQATDLPVSRADSVEAATLNESQADKKLLKKLEEVGLPVFHDYAVCSCARLQLFEERPIWTRAAIFNQFNSHEVREIVKYVFL